MALWTLLLTFALADTPGPAAKVVLGPGGVRLLGPDLVRRPGGGGGCGPPTPPTLGYDGGRMGRVRYDGAGGLAGHSGRDAVRDVAATPSGWVVVRPDGLHREGASGRARLVAHDDLWRVAVTPDGLGALDGDGRLHSFDLAGRSLGEPGPALPGHALVAADPGDGARLVQLPGAVAVAMDLDGEPGDEVVVGDGKTVVVYRWTGEWTGVTAWTGSYVITGVARADLDGDPNADLVVLAGSSLWRLLARGDGWERDGLIRPDGGRAWALGTGDLSGDGRDALLIGLDKGSSGGRSWGLYVVDGEPGGHRAPRTLPGVDLSRSTGAADLDGDGDDELVITVGDGLRLLDADAQGLVHLGEVAGREVRGWTVRTVDGQRSLAWAAGNGVWSVNLGEDGRPGQPVRHDTSAADAVAWVGTPAVLMAATEGVWRPVGDDGPSWLLSGHVRHSGGQTTVWWSGSRGRWGLGSDPHSVVIASGAALPRVYSQVGRVRPGIATAWHDRGRVTWAGSGFTSTHGAGKTTREAGEVLDLATWGETRAAVTRDGLTLVGPDPAELDLEVAHVVAVADGFVAGGDDLFHLRPAADGWQVEPLPALAGKVDDLLHGDLDGRGVALIARSGGALYVLRGGLWEARVTLPRSGLVLLADLDGDGVHTVLQVDRQRRAVARIGGPWRHLGEGAPFVAPLDGEPGDDLGLLHPSGALGVLGGRLLDQAPVVLDDLPARAELYLDVDGDGTPDPIDRNVVRLGSPWFVDLAFVPHPR